MSELEGDDALLWHAYLRTRVRIRTPTGEQITFEQADAEVTDPWLLDEYPCAWLLTACNPRSVSLEEPENAARHELLHRELLDGGYSPWLATGFDPDDPQWSEPGWLVPGMQEAEAVKWGHRWEQNAIFGWTPRSWLLIGVLMDGRHEHGWRIASRDPAEPGL